MAHRKKQRDARDEGLIEDTRENISDAWTGVEHVGQKGVGKAKDVGREVVDETQDMIRGEDFDNDI